MAVVVPPPPALTGDLSLFYTTDPLLSNLPVVVFHGPSTTIGSTSSRVQVHIFTAAGYGSYPRLAVSPTQPFYSAVSNLPREEQGDEICRGIAFALKKYFSELPEKVKKRWCEETKTPSSSALFADDHVAILATRMTLAHNVEEVAEVLKQAFREERVSWMDVDVVLPPGSIKDLSTSNETDNSEDQDDSQLLRQKYGKCADLVESFGEVAFLPTSKMKRAPSKASNIGRTASFLKHQKENIRKEVTELVETEVSYVQRTNELCQIAERLSADLDPDAQDDLRTMFPGSLAAISAINGQFLESLRAVFDSTSSDAIQDIEATPEEVPSAKLTRQDQAADFQGIGLIAQCLCDWLPRFKECYGAYLREHARCAQLLRELLRSESELAASIHEFGEQKLTSLLIEPVQRLPRYSLYIDTITKQLPARHPAIKQLLKARDLVSEICDQEEPGSSAASTIEKLRARISAWPSPGPVLGRLVTAADFDELDAPEYLSGPSGSQGVLLLFSDGIVLLEKRKDCAASARSLLTELESSPPLQRSALSRPGTPQDLKFSRHVPLDKLDVLEGVDGPILQVFTPTKDDSTFSISKRRSCQTLRMEGSYERRIERLAEEISKARVEGRFSEAEREGSKWEFRASDPIADAASQLSAVFEDSNADFVNTRRDRAPTRVVVDIDRHSQKPRAGQDGLRTVVCATPLRDGFWRLTFDSIDGSINHEVVEVANVTTIIRRRLMTLASTRFAIASDDMTGCLLARNAKVLRSIDFQTGLEEQEVENQSPVREKTKQPKSPRKLLSSFLSSSGIENQPPLLKKDLPPLPPSAPRYSIAPAPSKPPSRESRPTSRDQPTPKSVSSMLSTEQLSSPIRKLEETLSCYMLALQARKGNIVGRSLKMRSAADELAVNELYNTLLEDPSTMFLAAQASVDVLFAAFEKFLNVAWADRIGQLLPLSLLQQIQTKAETMFPSDFDQYFHSALDALPPQNQRAFKGIMRLLADLLDGTGNDSDRGSLTAAFAEVLVPEGNAHDYIALIDRFVDDPDTYFGEPLEEVQKQSEPTGGSHKRARSVNSASVTSNTSSLRRKFGLGALSRENSKSESESKMASVWRTLSKSTRGDASPGNSISKGSLFRAHTTDTDMRSLPSRPTSQDGGLQKMATSAGEDTSLIGKSSSNQNLTLSTIGEHPSFIPKQPARKKRRSSLSDLAALEDVTQGSPLLAPPSIRLPTAMQKSPVDKSLPNSPMPSTPSSKAGTGHFGTPSKEPLRSKLPPSFRKENSPSPVKASVTTDMASPVKSTAATEHVVITSRSPSNIPTLNPKPSTSPQKASASPVSRKNSGLSERRDAGNAVKRPSPASFEKEQTLSAAASLEATARTTTVTTPSGSPKKLRMQSPQKLRERLLNEQSAVAAAHNTLQDELSLIGDELTSSTATPNRMNSIRNSGRVGRGAARNHEQLSGSSGVDLAARVLKMESALPTQIDDLSTRITAIQTDLSTSLTVSESKCRKLDTLYREANSENEALYTRFNDELGRILKSVRSGEGVEELKRLLRECQEEATKLKRENGRLKRENLGLRSQLKE